MFYVKYIDMVNIQMGIAVVIHTLIGLILLADPDYGFMGYFVGIIVLLNIIGIALIKSGKIILGAKVFLISSAIMVPIGMIGAIGARKIIDEENKKEFYNSQNN